MWIVVYTAQTKETAEQVAHYLEEAGLLFKVRPIAAAADSENACFDVLVPESEAEQAHNVLIDRDV